MGKKKKKNKGAAEQKEEVAYKVALSIEHADDIFNQYKDRSLFYLKKEWYRANAAHSRLVYDPEAWYIDAQELVQAWHDLLGVTAILKHWYEWDEQGKCPKLNY